MNSEEDGDLYSYQVFRTHSRIPRAKSMFDR